MWIYLRHYAEVDIEMKIESFEGDIGSKTAVFPFVAEGIRHEGAVSSLHH